MDNTGDIAVIDESLRSDLHISDVLDVITHDPQFCGEVEAAMGDRPAPPARPHVRIVEQPASKALRFRYPCESRYSGSILGANSTPQEKTYPTIEICNYPGKAIVVVSCVTKDKPYRPHPHNIVGREFCKKGVCNMKLNGESPRVSFSNLGIQCVKRRDIEEALRVREELKVDPFKTGFSHKSQPQNIDLNAVRLCFQVFLVDSAGKIRNALQPVVSEVIYDKKAMSDLVISKISHRSASVLGGQQVILCCEKVAREDISVSFFEVVDGVERWRAEAGDLHVHKQVALVFRTPRYPDLDKQEHVNVFVQLRRPSDNATSDPIEFELIPSHYTESLKPKRKKPLIDIERFTLPDTVEHDINKQYPDYYKMMPQPNAELNPVKLEPLERTSPRLYPSPHMETTYTQWPLDKMSGGGLVMAGSSQYPPQWGQPSPSVSPNMQPLNMRTHMHPNMSPNMHPNMSPNMHPNMSPSMHPNMSPNMHQTMSPIGQPMASNMQAMSPNNMQHNMQAISPNMQAMSPNMQAMSPSMQAMSPNMQAMSPNMQHAPLGHVSPNLTQMSNVGPVMGHVSPNLQHQQQQYVAHVNLPQNPMDSTLSDTPSLSEYCNDENMNSTEMAQLSGLSGFLDGHTSGPSIRSLLFIEKRKSCVVIGVLKKQVVYKTSATPISIQDFSTRC